MSIYLDQFIASKPAELRLGQWFIICYCKPVKGRWPISIDNLWNIDGNEAAVMIRSLMSWWQWDSLPDIPVRD